MRSWAFLSLSLGQELIRESRLPPALRLPSIAGSHWTWLFPAHLLQEHTHVIQSIPRSNQQKELKTSHGKFFALKTKHRTYFYT